MNRIIQSSTTAESFGDGGNGWRGDPYGLKLKTKNGWTKNGNGTDDFGFSILPCGKYYSGSGDFNEVGGYAYFWTSTNYNLFGNGDKEAYCRFFCNTSSGIYRGSDWKLNNITVRCIKDE